MVTKLNLLALVLFLYPASQAQISGGYWSTGCINGLKKEQVYGNNNKVISTESFYQDADCKVESFRFQTIGLVSYYQNSPEFIDFVYQEIYLSVFKQNVIEDLNLRKVCGYSDWTKAGAQNITGLKCTLFNINKPTQIPAAGDLKYGIFLVEKTKLYYGQLSPDFDGSTPAKRPGKINSLIEYIFQNSP